MELGTEVLPGIVVDAAWLAEHATQVVTADVRWYLDGRSGRVAYDGGHLPGAVFVDLDAALSNHDDTDATHGRHPLPDPAAFAAALGGLGIGDDTPVVAYDDAGGGVAGRLVWMLRAQGTPAALLDGGLRAWRGALEVGGATTTRPAARRTARPWPVTALATPREIDGGAPGLVLLDARAPERYRGETEPVDPRAGHIPGARNLPVGRVLDADTGCLADPATLRERFAAAGVTSGADVVSSCGSGVSACILLIAMEHAGVGQGRLFVPSFSGWASDPERTVTTGATP